MTLFEEIYSAAINQRLELLSNFDSIDVRNCSGLTPAGKLASEGNANLAMILHRQFGSNVNYIAMGAAEGGYTGFAMKLLHEHGADVDSITMGAARGGHLEFAMKLLHEHGANVNNIALGAAHGGHTEFTMKLLHEYRADVSDIAMYAARGGHTEFAIKLLHKHGANINDIAMGAARGGHTEFAMKLLHEHGANVNDIAMGAAQGGHTEFAMKLLHEHGANVNDIAMGAAQAGHAEFAMKLLHKHDANVNDIAMGAAQGGHTEFAIKLLHKHGANVNKIALYAAQNGYTQFAMKLLHEHGANVDYIAMGAAHGGHTEFAMKLLHEHGANVDYIAMGAAHDGHTEFAMKLLHEHDANVDSIANGAAHGGRTEFGMKLFHKHGADIKYLVQDVNECTNNVSSMMQYILSIDHVNDQKKIIALFQNEPSFNTVVKEKFPRIAKKIEQIHHFKQIYDVGMQHAQFLQMCPEIRAWMIQCYAPFINGRCAKMPYALPKEIFLLITLFLAPVYMSFEGVEELLFKLQQKTLINALNSYAKPVGWFKQWFTRKPIHEERAQSVQDVIQKTANLGEMAALVCKQHGMFSVIDKYNSAGETLLVIATSNKDITKVEYLLKAGANPDKPELKNKRTPLSIAVLANREDLVKCLLQYHARTDLEDIDGNTPYHLAQNNGINAEMIHLLSSAPVAPEPGKHEKPLENDTQDAYYSLLHRSRMRLD